MGAGKEDKDARARTFEAVMQWIQALADRGCLRFFVLENVAGILIKRSRDESSFGQRLMSRWQRELPAGWTVVVWKENSLDHALPHSRPRVFFVGVSAWMTRTALQKRLFRRGPERSAPVHLADFLEHTSCAEDYEGLSFNQKFNVDWHCEEWWSEPRPFAGVVDIARNPSKKVDS